MVSILFVLKLNASETWALIDRQSSTWCLLQILQLLKLDKRPYWISSSVSPFRAFSFSIQFPQSVADVDDDAATKDDEEQRNNDVLRHILLYREPQFHTLPRCQMHFWRRRRADVDIWWQAL